MLTIHPFCYITYRTNKITKAIDFTNQGVSI